MPFLTDPDFLARLTGPTPASKAHKVLSGRFAVALLPPAGSVPPGGTLRTRIIDAPRTRDAAHDFIAEIGHEAALGGSVLVIDLVREQAALYNVAPVALERPYFLKAA